MGQFWSEKVAWKMTKTTERHRRTLGWPRMRCEACGSVRRTNPRHKRCRLRRFGQGSYACWGRLVPATRKAVTVVMMKRPQDVAQQKLDRARRMVTEKTRAMKRLATSLRLWEGRARYYAQRASLTDAEIEAERARRKERQLVGKARKVKRAVTLVSQDGGV